jgi:hypothetical protein
LATVKDSTLVRLPPSEDTFKQHVLRSSYQTKIWLNAHIPKPVVGSPLEHGWKDGQFGLDFFIYYIYITPVNNLPLGARKPQRFTNVYNEQYN